MQFIDDAEFQIAIDDDNGARITSLKWRENEFAVPFRGQVHTSGWYSMAPWAGRIKEGFLKARHHLYRRIVPAHLLAVLRLELPSPPVILRCNLLQQFIGLPDTLSLQFI